MWTPTDHELITFIVACSALLVFLVGRAFPYRRARAAEHGRERAARPDPAAYMLAATYAYEAIAEEQPSPFEGELSREMPDEWEPAPGDLIRLQAGSHYEPPGPARGDRIAAQETTRDAAAGPGAYRSTGFWLAVVRPELTDSDFYESWPWVKGELMGRMVRPFDLPEWPAYERLP